MYPNASAYSWTISSGGSNQLEVTIPLAFFLHEYTSICAFTLSRGIQLLGHPGMYYENCKSFLKN